MWIFSITWFAWIVKPHFFLQKKKKKKVKMLSDAVVIIALTVNINAREEAFDPL